MRVMISASAARSTTKRVPVGLFDRLSDRLFHGLLAGLFAGLLNEIFDRPCDGSPDSSDQDAGLRILRYEGAAFRGPGWVDRQVGRSRLPRRQRRDHIVEGPFQANRYRSFLPRPLGNGDMRPGGWLAPQDRHTSTGGRRKKERPHRVRLCRGRGYQLRNARAARTGRARRRQTSQYRDGTRGARPERHGNWVVWS